MLLNLLITRCSVLFLNHLHLVYLISSLCVSVFDCYNNIPIESVDTKYFILILCLFPLIFNSVGWYWQTLAFARSYFLTSVSNISLLLVDRLTCREHCLLLVSPSLSPLTKSNFLEAIWSCCASSILQIMGWGSVDTDAGIVNFLIASNHIQNVQNVPRFREGWDGTSIKCY